MSSPENRFLIAVLLTLGLATSFVACKKAEMPKLVFSMDAVSWGSTSINNTSVTNVCINKGFTEQEKRDNGPHGKNAPYKTVVWGDEFNGPGSSTPAADPGCYSDDTNARCSKRLDWFGDAFYEKCAPYDLTHLRSLNKCTWTLWAGYSYWDGSGKSAYSPDQIQLRHESDIDSGVMALKIHVDQNAKGDCINEGSLAGCQWLSGGVDSKPRDGNIKGYQVTEGRVEMYAKLPTGQNGYPALWMWQNQDGGDTHLGEIDLWESPRNFMTEYTFGYSHYHDWFGPNIGHVSSIGYDTMVNVKDGLYHAFGVERTSDSLKFYIDDCYTGYVKNGDMSKGRNMAPLEINSLPQFMMMGMSATGAGFSDPSSVEGQEMLIDYVRVYGQ